jgi:hypothetical protein
MKTPKHSVRKIVRCLNNSDEDSGFWLPDMQSPLCEAMIRYAVFKHGTGEKTQGPVGIRGGA